MSTKSNLPAKMYATVLADGTSEQFKTKKQAVARGEHSGQSFTVLSPRGFEVHVHTAPEPDAGRDVAGEDVQIGMTVIYGAKQDKEAEVDRIRIGRKHITVFSGEKVIAWVPVAGGTVRVR